MTALSPELTTLAALSCLVLTAAALAFSAASRRRLAADRVEASRRLDALAERVALLEARSGERPNLPPTPQPSAPVRRVDRPDLSAVAGPTLIAVPNLAAAGPATPPPDLATSELGRRFAEIWDLVDGGASAEVVARATGQPIGQVELILGLRRQLTAAGGTRLAMTPAACLERTRSAVLNVMIAAGTGIAVSGWLLRWRDGWALFRAPRGVGRGLTAGMAVVAVASYAVRRSAAVGDPSRFYRRHVLAAGLAALGVPLGLTYGWVVRPRLDAVGPFWVAALALGFLALPRARERLCLDTAPGEGKRLP